MSRSLAQSRTLRYVSVAIGWMVIVGSLTYLFKQLPIAVLQSLFLVSAGFTLGRWVSSCMHDSAVDALADRVDQLTQRHSQEEGE